MKYNKRRGFFCKKVKRWEVSLLNRGKARGFWAYCPVLFLPSRRETGEGEVARRRCRIRQPGARGGSGVRGKGSGRPAGPIPGRSSGGVVPGRSGRDGGRRRAAVASGRCPRGAAESKGRGKASRGSGNSIHLLTLGGGGLWMALHDGGRSLVATVAIAVLEARGGAVRWWPVWWCTGVA